MTDFDYVQDRDGKVWRYVDRLEDAERDRATALVAGNVRRSRVAMGLVPVPAKRDDRRLWCGHPVFCALERDGVSVCTECGGEGP